MRFLILLSAGAFALSVLWLGLTISRVSVPAALTVMALSAVMAIGVIVLIVRAALQPEPIPRATPATQDNDASQRHEATS